MAGILVKWFRKLWQPEDTLAYWANILGLDLYEMQEQVEKEEEEKEVLRKQKEEMRKSAQQSQSRQEQQEGGGGLLLNKRDRGLEEDGNNSPQKRSRRSRWSGSQSIIVRIVFML